MLDRFKKQAASWSRRVLFVNVIFAVSISAANHPPAFSKSFGRAGGRAGGRAVRAVRAVRVGSRASSCDTAGGSAAPPQPLSGSSPPPFLSLARACNLLAFFFSGQSFGRWRSCADAVRKKKERRVCLLVGCSLFQRKRQNKTNLKLKCTNSRSLAEAERSFSLL